MWMPSTGAEWFLVILMVILFPYGAMWIALLFFQLFRALFDAWREELASLKKKNTPE